MFNSLTPCTMTPLTPWTIHVPLKFDPQSHGETLSLRRPILKLKSNEQSVLPRNRLWIIRSLSNPY